MKDAAGREAIKARYEEAVGPWAPMYDPLLEADPELMDAFVDLCAVPVSHGRLEPKLREFVGIAVTASTAHLYEPPLRAHIRSALALGAEQPEINAVLELAGVPGTQPRAAPGVLPTKVRELLSIAIAASTTKLHEPATRLHLQNALRAGATKEEIVEVLELISRIGIHAAAMGVPIVLEEARLAQRR